MLRFTPALAALLAAASVSAQQASRPQPDTPQKPGQSTQIQNPNNAQRPNANPGAAQADPNQSVTPPRNDVPDRNARGNRQPGRGNPQAQSGDHFDSHVADCLILSNQEEIALLKFGVERTKSDKVKQLAQSMIKDHEKAIGELRQFASPQHANEELTAFKEGDREVASREARKVPADAADDAGGQNSFMAKMHRMAKRGHEQCLVLNREELTKYEGHEFDQAFLGQQLGAHIGMLAKLKAAQEETSGELSQWTGKAQETTKKHKDHLDKLMNDLAKDAHSKK